ncbi:MAG: hypothetical protein H0T84_05395 [Tatlockia sp.]|nr:hypothetical protein [Tatlockia sp.]
MSLFWNMWKRFSSAVNEVRNWPSRHPVESLLLYVASIAIAVAGAVINPIASGVAGAALAIGGTYVCVKKNIAEKGEIEKNIQNADLRRDIADLRMEQQKINTINSQLRTANLENQQTIDRQVKSITNLQANKIQDKTVEPISQTINSSAKVSTIGKFSRSEVRHRNRTHGDAIDPTNFEAKI